MNKFLLALLVVMSASLYAQDGAEIVPAENDEKIVEEAKAKPSELKPLDNEFVAASAPDQKIETSVVDPKKFNPRASHWISTFGFENSKYDFIPDKKFEFDGRKDFRVGKQEIWGGRIGFGGELYLGKGFLTRSMVEGYYMGTLFSRILNGGAAEKDVKFAYTKKTSQLMGFDASQSLGWMFDFKAKNPFMDTYSYLNLETYVEAGIGKAWAYNRVNYSYDTGTAPSAARETYRLRVRDDLLNARIGGGFNLTSREGFFLSLKATINRYDVTQRKIDGYSQPTGQGSTPINEKQKNASMDPVIIYALGGGYKF